MLNVIVLKTHIRSDQIFLWFKWTPCQFNDIIIWILVTVLNILILVMIFAELAF